jgi:DNA-binding CsgD family transcriptional regulator
MLLAARGDVPSALMHAARAVDAHRSAGQPFELGRTLLSLGTIERRARRWGDARRSLEEARDVFSGLQARLWEQSSRTELDRVGGRRALPGKLTATERQVAELVASGRTNREVAGLMFMSINTVESNLSRIYTKFGIRSRTALATHLTEASKG